jgi:hypothetical protein
MHPETVASQELNASHMKLFKLATSRFVDDSAKSVGHEVHSALLHFGRCCRTLKIRSGQTRLHRNKPPVAPSAS